VWHVAQLLAKIACASGVDAGCCAMAPPLEHSQAAMVSGTIVSEFFPCATRIT
jgi:hypothetical protein